MFAVRERHSQHDAVTVRIFSADGHKCHTLTGQSDVVDVAQLRDGRIIATDASLNVIHVWNGAPHFKYIGTKCTPGAKSGQLQHPEGICILPNDRFAVVDSANNRIQVFSSQDFSVCQIIPIPSHARVHHIEADMHGCIYASCERSQVIQQIALDRSGNISRREINVGCTVSSFCVFSDGTQLALVSPCGTKVRIVRTIAGRNRAMPYREFITAHAVVGQLATALQQNEAYQIVSSSDGSLVILDGPNCRVQRLDPSRVQRNSSSSITSPLTGIDQKHEYSQVGPGPGSAPVSNSVAWPSSNIVNNNTVSRYGFGDVGNASNQVDYFSQIVRRPVISAPGPGPGPGPVPALEPDNSNRTVSVSGYVRSNGTVVAPYTRPYPGCAGPGPGPGAAAEPDSSSNRTVSVSGYVRSNGTVVAPYTRPYPRSGSGTTKSATIKVKGYYRSNGTYVKPHTRPRPQRKS
jgi:NHL repeat